METQNVNLFVIITLKDENLGDGMSNVLGEDVRKPGPFSNPAEE